MPLVPIRIPRTSKPPLGTPIDWSNPLAQGLVGAWAFNEGAGNTAYNPAGRPLLLNSGAVLDSVTAKFDASNDYGVVSAIPQTADMTVVYQGKINGYANNNAQLCESSSDSNGGNAFYIRPNGGGSATGRYAVGYIGPSGSLQVSFPRPTNDHTAVVVLTRLQISAYFNGVAQPANTHASPAYSSLNGTQPLYFNSRGGAALFLGCSINCFYIFSRALSPAEIASLSANPWQIYEPEIIWVEVGSGASAALLEGILSGTASTSAALTTAITMAAQSSGSATATADLTTSIALAAQILASGTAAGDLTTAISLAGQSSGQSSTTAELLSAITLAGSSQGISSVTAQLTTAIRLAAIAAGVGSLAGDLAGTVAAAILAGTAAGSSSVDADLLTAIPLAGSALGSGATQAQLSTAITLAAAAQGDSAAQAALATAISLSAQVNGTSSVQGVLAGALAVLGYGFVLPPEIKGYVLQSETRGFVLPAETKGYTL